MRSVLFKFTLLFLLCQLVTSCFRSSSLPQKAPHVDRGEYITYTWKRGDKLQDVADDFNIPPKKILELNSIKVASQIKVGQKIKIPFPKAVRHKVKAEKKRSLSEINSGVFKKYYRKLHPPVIGGRLSSPFGQRKGSFHEGIDIVAEEGRKIFAAHSGVVIYSGNELSGYGNLIIIRGDQILTIYAHNKKNIVEAGDLVKRGQLVALVGKTGRASGPHLHFESRVIVDGKNYAPIDPMLFELKLF